MPAGTTRVLFLPGVSGDGRFWRPVKDRPLQGPHRIPTLLSRLDALARGRA